MLRVAYAGTTHTKQVLRVCYAVATLSLPRHYTCTKQVLCVCYAGAMVAKIVGNGYDTLVLAFY